MISGLMNSGVDAGFPFLLLPIVWTLDEVINILNTKFLHLESEANDTSLERLT